MIVEAVESSAPVGPRMAGGSCVFVYRGHPLDKDLGGALDGPGRKLVVNFGPDIFAHEHFGSEIAVEPYERYLCTDELHQLLATAYRLAPDWYQGLPEEAHVYEGISLGSVAAYDFVSVCVEALKGLRLAEQLIEIERPARLVLVNDGGVAFRAFQAVCRARRVELIGLNPGRSQANLLLRQPRLLRWHKVALAMCVAQLSRLALGRRARATPAARILLPQYFRFGPLVRGLATDPRFSITIIGGGARDVVRGLWRGGRVRYVLPSGYLGLGQLVSISRYERRLQQWVGELDTFAKRGPQFQGYLLQEVCRDVVEDHLRNRFPNYAAFVQIARAVLQREKTTHVIVNQDQWGYHRILCLVANDLGLHTISYQHGLSLNVPDITEHVCGSVAVWGQSEGDVYRRFGRPSAGRIRVVGDPLVASLSGRQFDRPTISRKLGLDPARPIILMTCERFVNCYSAYERETSANATLAQVCATAADNPDLQLLVRFKPGFVYGEFGDSIDLKHKIIERYNRGNIFPDRGGDLYEQLFVADVVIVAISTVGLEAMIFGKPVIVFASAGAAGLVEYVASGAAVHVTTGDEFRRALMQTLNDPAFRNRLRECQQRFVAHNFANLHDPDSLGRLRSLLLEKRESPTNAVTADAPSSRAAAIKMS